jgi:hypothetical protein
MHSQELQRKFFERVRNGDVKNFPEVQPSFYLYHKHMKGKLSNLLINSFPFAQEVLGDDKWDKAIAQFLAEYATSSETPLSLCFAFYQFLLENIAKQKNIANFFKDVVLFEYTLIELFHMENLPHVPFDTNGNHLETPLVLNPEHRLLSLDYPVFQNVTSLVHKSPCYLLMYRHAITFTVEFIEISALYYNALKILSKQTISILEAVEISAERFSLSMNDIDIDEMLDFVKELQNHGAIFGFAS